MTKTCESGDDEHCPCGAIIGKTDNFEWWGEEIECPRCHATLQLNGTAPCCYSVDYADVSSE